MATSLCKNTMARINKDYGELTVGSASSHIPGILFMARCVSDNKFALGCGKIAIGNINSNALFAFCLQAISQQCQIKTIIRGTGFHAVRPEGIKVILINHLGVVEQTSNKSAFTIVNTATGEQTQQFLAFMLGQVGINIGTDQF